MAITLDTVCSAVPAARRENLEKFFSGILDTIEKYDLSTPSRQAMFLAQCAHESANFGAVEENLNYSVKGLLNTWPKRFAGVADDYARNPEKIANRAYCNRLGNGDELSGDGWLYRGRGIIQLTGRANYATAGSALGLDLVGNPHLVSQNPAAVLTAGWFWDQHGLNALSDAQDTAGVTRVINGGLLGLDERHAAFQRALAVLSSVSQ